MRTLRYAVCLSAILATRVLAAVDDPADYRGLIFCARFAAGLHSVLVSIGEEDTQPARSALAAFQAFGVRATRSVPLNRYNDVPELVKASNDAVNRIIFSGDAETMEGISKACSRL